MRETILAALVMLLSMTLARAEETPPPGKDPWVGKTRAEVIEKLGQPTKAKNSRGGETLTYTFFRLDPELPPPLDMLLIPVPGLGIVGKHVEVGTASGGASPPVSAGPDERGRPITTDATSTETLSATYDPETGEIERTGSGSAVLGKVKLKLELDRRARVTRSSVSGKKEPAPR